MKEGRGVFMKYLILTFVLVTMFLFGGEAISANAIRVSDTWSGTIRHFSLMTGLTNTIYTYNIDVDKNYLARAEITYSGYTASYYTNRFMDPNISLGFNASFIYRTGNASGNVIGSVSSLEWIQGNKYSYILPGNPYRVSSGGSTKNIVAKTGENAHLTTTFVITCEKDTASLACGDRTFTKPI